MPLIDAVGGAAEKQRQPVPLPLLEAGLHAELAGESSASSTSKPVSRRGSAGSGNTCGPPPSWSAAQTSSPAAAHLVELGRVSDPRGRCEHREPPASAGETGHAPRRRRCAILIAPASAGGRGPAVLAAGGGQPRRRRRRAVRRRRSSGRPSPAASAKSASSGSTSRALRQPRDECADVAVEPDPHRREHEPPEHEPPEDDPHERLLQECRCPSTGRPCPEVAVEEVPARPHEHRHEQAGEQSLERPVQERASDPAAPLGDEPIDAGGEPGAGAVEQRARAVTGTRASSSRARPTSGSAIRGTGGQPREHAPRLFDLSRGRARAPRPPASPCRRRRPCGGCPASSRPISPPPPACTAAQNEPERRHRVQERRERAAVPAVDDVVGDQPLPRRAARPQPCRRPRGPGSPPAAAAPRSTPAASAATGSRKVASSRPDLPREPGGEIDGAGAPHAAGRPAHEFPSIAVQQFAEARVGLEAGRRPRGGLHAVERERCAARRNPAPRARAASRRGCRGRGEAWRLHEEQRPARRERRHLAGHDPRAVFLRGRHEQEHVAGRQHRLEQVAVAVGVARAGRPPPWRGRPCRVLRVGIGAVDEHDVGDRGRVAADDAGLHRLERQPRDVDVARGDHDGIHRRRPGDVARGRHLAAGQRVDERALAGAGAADRRPRRARGRVRGGRGRAAGRPASHSLCHAPGRRPVGARRTAQRAERVDEQVERREVGLRRRCRLRRVDQGSEPCQTHSREHSTQQPPRPRRVRAAARRRPAGRSPRRRSPSTTSWSVSASTRPRSADQPANSRSMSGLSPAIARPTRPLAGQRAPPTTSRRRDARAWRHAGRPRRHRGRPGCRTARA